MEQSKRADEFPRTTWRALTGHCVKLSADLPQRPTDGGEESMDKNKQRMTIPPSIVATHIAKPSSYDSLCNLAAVDG